MRLAEFWSWHFSDLGACSLNVRNRVNCGSAYKIHFAPVAYSSPLVTKCVFLNQSIRTRRGAAFHTSQTVSLAPPVPYHKSSFDRCRRQRVTMVPPRCGSRRWSASRARRCSSRRSAFSRQVGDAPAKQGVRDPYHHDRDRRCHLLGGQAPGVPSATRTSILRPASSSARSGKRSTRPGASRHTRKRFPPST
jgi:hypothetical protein